MDRPFESPWAELGPGPVGSTVGSPDPFILLSTAPSLAHAHRGRAGRQAGRQAPRSDHHRRRRRRRNPPLPLNPSPPLLAAMEPPASASSSSSPDPTPQDQAPSPAKRSAWKQPAPNGVVDTPAPGPAAMDAKHWPALSEAAKNTKLAPAPAPAPDSSSRPPESSSPSPAASSVSQISSTRCPSVHLLRPAIHRFFYFLLGRGQAQARLGDAPWSPQAGQARRRRGPLPARPPPSWSDHR
jgi:hypothetical protein